ncbi:integrase core domain-containing protein, partial [Corynebacterium belfantii]
DTNRIRNNHGTSRIPCGLKIRRKTVNQTLSRPARPEAVVLHADRGCQFTSTQLSRFATNIGATLSMGRTGVCWDNAMAESFWASLKIEKFYRRAYATRRQVYSDISAWIEGFYNHKRIHSSIGMQSPIEYELALQQHTAQAA